MTMLPLGADEQTAFDAGVLAGLRFAVGLGVFGWLLVTASAAVLRWAWRRRG